MILLSKKTIKPIVLIVEDDRTYQKRYQWGLEDKIEVLLAETIEEAQDHFVDSRHRIAAIVMDACVPYDHRDSSKHNSPTTIDLTQSFRKMSSAPIIAASGEPSYCDQLIAAGCNHSSQKSNVCELLAKLLRLDETVHIEHGGKAICAFTLDPPKDWPVKDTHVSFENRLLANCSDCVEEAERMITGVAESIVMRRKGVCAVQPSQHHSGILDMP